MQDDLRVRVFSQGQTEPREPPEDMIKLRLMLI